jgi:hypothetical protein
MVHSKQALTGHWLQIKSLSRKKLLSALLVGRATDEEEVKDAIDAALQEPELLLSILKYCFPNRFKPEESQFQIDHRRGWRSCE